MNFDIEEHEQLANGQVDPYTDTDMALNKQKPLLLGKTRQTQKHSNWGQNHNKLIKPKSHEETGANTKCPEGRSSPRDHKH